MPTLTLPHPAIKIPRRLAPVAFAFLMSVTLSGMISFALTAINTGVGPGFIDRWLHAYLLAWSIAFPSVTLIAPRIRRLVERVTA